MRRDLALTPFENITAAEESLRAVGRSPLAASANDPLVFENFDAFLTWNRERVAMRKAEQ